MTMPKLSREPDLKGARGMAWHSPPLTEEVLAAHPDWRGGIGLWLLHAPMCHPVWHNYIVSGIHLRTIAGVRPATIKLHGATHEMSVFATDPIWTPDDGWCVDGDGRWARFFLSPLNLCEQVVLQDDEAMGELLRIYARSCCIGTIDPELPRSVQSHSIQATATHLREGKHLPH